MARLHPLAAVLLVILAGCSDQSTPLSPEPDQSPSNAQAAPSAASMLGGAVKLVVVATEESRQPDGTLSTRFITTTSYDQHGNPVEEESHQDGLPAGLHWKTVFNQHGNVVHQVFDFYLIGTSDIWVRRTLSTTAYDPQGNPTEQLSAIDFSGDGTVESRQPIWITYDPRGNAIKTVIGNFNDAGGINYMETRTYDAHGNIVRFSNERMFDGTADLQLTTSSSYSHHDALVAYVTDRTPNESGTPDSRETLSTIAYDQRGNPVQQEIENATAGGTSSTSTVTIGPYDEHRNPLRRVFVGDGANDGTIYAYMTITYQYFGQGHASNASTSKHAGAAAQAALRNLSVPFVPGATGGDASRTSPGRD